MIALLRDFDEDMVACSPSWQRFLDATPRGFAPKHDPHGILATAHAAKEVFEKHRGWTLRDWLVSRGEAQECDAFIDLLERMLSLNPERRLSARQALAHPFISDAGLGAWEPAPEVTERLFAPHATASDGGERPGGAGHRLRRDGRQRFPANAVTRTRGGHHRGALNASRVAGDRMRAAR